MTTFCTAFAVLASAALAGSNPEPSFASATSDPQDRLNPIERPDIDAEAVSAPAAPSAIEVTENPAAAITRIEFVGTMVPAPVARAASPYIGRPADLETIKALTAAMTAAYQQSDIALFTIVVPEQDLSGGIVKVLIAEGYIESVSFTGETEGRNLSQIESYANRLKAERPLTRRTFERYLSLINDIPGLRAKPSLSIGSQRGAAKLVLDLDFRKPTVSGGFTNRTSRFVDDGQFSAEAKAFRLLREGDVTRVNLAASVDFSESLYAGVQHTTPVLRDGATLTLAAAWLKSRPSDTPIEGDAQIYSIEAAAPVIRSFKHNLTLKASLDAVNSENAAFGSVIATERTRAIRASASYGQTLKTQSFRLAAGTARGLEMLDAETNPLLADPDFTKITASAFFAQKLTDDLTLRLRGSAQWTDDLMPANERFNIGGAIFGRAFDNGLINADRGAAVSIEPAFRPVGGGDFSKSEIYAFADYGAADIFSRGAAPSRSIDLGSYGAGLRVAYKSYAMLEVEAAHAYDLPAPGTDQDWRFSIRWRVNYRPDF